MLAAPASLCSPAKRCNQAKGRSDTEEIKRPSPLSRATNLGRALQLLEMHVHNAAPITPSAASEVRGFSAKKNGRPGHPWTFLLACKSATRFVVVVSTAHPTRRITVELEISEKVARTADGVIGVGNVPHLLLLHLGTALAVCAVVSSPV